MLMRRLPFLCALAMALCVPAVTHAECVFVNTGRVPSQIQAFHVDAGGTLTNVTGSPFNAAGGGGRALTTVGNHLYAIAFPFKPVLNKAVLPIGLICGFAIAPDCSLSPLPSPSVWSTEGLFSSSVVANPAGTRLFVNNLNDGTIMVHDIAADGSLTPITKVPFVSEPTPADLAVSPDGKHLFVSHGAHGLGVYDIAGDGNLSEIAGSPFASEGSPLFQSNVLTPNGLRFYAADRGNARINGFSVGADGALSALPGSPYATGNEPDDIALSPNGRLLFASNFADSTLSVFAIAADGALAPVPGSPFPSHLPQGLAINPAGSILYSLAFINGSTYQIDATSVSAAGALAPISGSPFAAGSGGAATRLVYYPPPSGATPVTEIPTLAPAAFVLLAALIALAAFTVLRRRA